MICMFYDLYVMKDDGTLMLTGVFANHFEISSPECFYITQNCNEIT